MRFTEKVRGFIKACGLGKKCSIYVRDIYNGVSDCMMFIVSVIGACNVSGLRFGAHSGMKLVRIAIGHIPAYLQPSQDCGT